MSQGDDILNRMIAFAVAISRVCRLLPRNRTTTHICGQLLRSGTAVAPNYAEARAAESLQDFIRKLGIALKELNETLVWLKMLQQMDFVETASMGPLVKE
jgi:four helix bundle protein